MAEAAIEIFQSFEKQFLEVTDKAGYSMALEKLADDASARSLNYLDSQYKKLASPVVISSEIIGISILKGRSDSFFDPSFKKTRVVFHGYEICDQRGNPISIDSLLKKVGIIIKSKLGLPDRFYKRNIPESTLYGFRRPLSWEINADGTLKASEYDKYIEENLSDAKPYEYQLNTIINVQQEARQVLERVGLSNTETPNNKAVVKNIIFNLRHPLKNFSGRSQLLIELHQLLSTSSKSAVLTQMAQLSLSPDTFGQPLQEGPQATVTGLGGIGKTQLALKYANQYAADYDNNIIWVDSEKKVDIVDSFKQLAQRLAINLYDFRGNEKPINQIVDEIYDFFSSSKSLFIFDNAEHPKELIDFLPKASSSDKPTVLITSRYSNWKNIASPLRLGVFEKSEAFNFIRNEMATIGDKENMAINELADLLQLLPLALQQAVAYIHSEKILNPNFGIQDYIDRFKKKQNSLELLNFDLQRNTNDPYSKTIATAWEITLEKIKQDEHIGAKAIETIQVMAYLYPDNIDNSILAQLPNQKHLGSAIFLLRAYSLIDEGTQPHISTIHRLVQKVLRLQLEHNRKEFEMTVKKINYLTLDFRVNKNIMSHYFTFQLHMLEHRDFTKTLDLRVSNRRIIESLACYERDKNLLTDLFDFAAITLPRNKFLNFIGEALAVYMRQPFLIALNNAINYLDQKISEKLISLAEAKIILDFKYQLSGLEYKWRMSSNPRIRSLQINAMLLTYSYEKKLFPDNSDRYCSPTRKKRSIKSACVVGVDKVLLRSATDVQQIKAYVEKIRAVANLANLGLITKDTFSALIQGDLKSVAINFALISGSHVLGKISNHLLIQGGEQLALGDEKLLLHQELDYDMKLAADIFTDKAIMQVGKRRFLGNAMKAAAPFVARGTSLFFAYDLVKGLMSNQTDFSNTLSNAAIVGLDVGEAGIEAMEYLGYIAGISEFTGPVGEGIGFLIIAGMQLYHVEKELTAIEQWVHLSGRERFIQGIRAFFDFQPSKYLEAKANNNQLISKAITFLKLHPEIHRYIFSAWANNTLLTEKNFVFLDHPRNLTLKTESIPDEPEEGHLFCLPGLTSSQVIEEFWVKAQLESLFELDVESLLGVGDLLGFEERYLNFCHNTIGVEYEVNRTGNATLIALQGDSIVIGGNSDTIYLINNGHHHYRGGAGDDLFILQGTHISGSLHGGLGINILKFSNYQVKNGSMLLDSNGFLCEKNSLINDNEILFFTPSQLSNFTGAQNKFSIVQITVDSAFKKNSVKAYINTEIVPNNPNTTLKVNHAVLVLTGNNSDTVGIYTMPVDHDSGFSPQFNKESLRFEEFCSVGLRLNNITQIYGRNNKQDKISLIEGISHVDMYAGESTVKPDYIYITKNSSKIINLVLRTNTVVHILPRNTTNNLVTYHLPERETGNAFIRLPLIDQTIHQFYFETAFDNLMMLNIEKDRFSFLLSHPNGYFNLTCQNLDPSPANNVSSLPNSFFSQSSYYIFNQTLDTRLVDDKTLYAQWRGNNSVYEVILSIAPIAQRIEKSILLQSGNDTIIIASKQQPILSTDGLGVNHLVSNGEDALYIIHPAKNHSFPFPLRNISLYNLDKTPSITQTLDLREVIKNAKNSCSQDILPTLSEEEADLVLSLYATYYLTALGQCLTLETPLPLIHIRLKDTLYNDWHKYLDIIFHERTTNIIDEKENWKLVSSPLAFPPEKNIIVLTDIDIDKNDELFILKNMGQCEFKRLNASDLLLTNLFSNVSETELYTIIFSNFFKNLVFKQKVETLTLRFLDATWILNEHTDIEINNATDFFHDINTQVNASQVILNQSDILHNDSSSPSLSRVRREIFSITPPSSGSSKLTLSYIFFPLTKMLQFFAYNLNCKKNRFNTNYLQKKLTNKNIKVFIEPIEKTNDLVNCQPINFKEIRCIKSQFALGLLGYCTTVNQAFVWFNKNPNPSSAPSKPSWFSIAYTHDSTKTSDKVSILLANNLSLINEQLFFYDQDHCQQTINLNKINNVSLTTLFPYLPREVQQWLFEEWTQENNKHNKLQNDHYAQKLFKQNALLLTWHHLGSTILLHTFIGDHFQALGLRPNWRENDPSYFLSRWLSAIQQIHLSGTWQIYAVSAALLETALLHPKIQTSITFINPKINFYYKKRALRFCADLLQWGNLTFASLPSLLELLCVDYPPIKSITWGLRAALSFYAINNDPSYYYLGIALFLLPQLPLLLEHLGIPVTALISRALEKLTQLFIFKSMLEQFKPALDESRIKQRQIELQQAEQRVTNGSARVSTVIKPLISFFKPKTKCLEQDTEYLYEDSSRNRSFTR